ncbi:MAG: response regulator transcription factor [Cryomorphaceae bacterium]
MGLNVLIAEDHEIFRNAIADTLIQLDEVDAVFHASDGRECLQQLDKHPTDVVLLDLSMPNMDGIHCIEKIRAQRSEIPAIVLTQYDEPSFFRAMMSRGASAYLTKSTSSADFIKDFLAIVRYGECRISQSALVKLNEANKTLTTRELEILFNICNGLTTHEIAESLHISLNTVNSHRTSIAKKLGSNKVADMMKWAVLNGHFSIDPCMK